MFRLKWVVTDKNGKMVAPFAYTLKGSTKKYKPVDKWMKVKTPLVMCKRGFHCPILDADKLISWQPICFTGKKVELWIVEVRGENLIRGSKECWQEMRFVEKVSSTNTSVKFPVAAIRQVINKIEKMNWDGWRIVTGKQIG